MSNIFYIDCIYIGSETDIKYPPELIRTSFEIDVEGLFFTK